MKLFKYFALLLSTIYNLLFTMPVEQALAASVEPFPPFSVEGNPEEDYYFSEIFPLFRYMRAPNMEIYENRDRSRNYERYDMCPGPEADRRDYECDNQGDGCDGGEVDICFKGTADVAYTTHSTNGSCKLFRKRTEGPDEYIAGRCEYKDTPAINSKYKGTDFAINESLVYPKIQSEALQYGNFGSDNSITWGSQFLSSNFCDITLRQLLVVKRAKQTKATVNQFGEWPLGWVDWGYVTKNGSTLIDIYESLPDSIAAPLIKVTKEIDDFFIYGGNVSTVSNTNNEKRAICDVITKTSSQSSPPEWYTNLIQVPQFPPSFRQGYVRPSICVWDICCPGGRCKLSEEQMPGQKRGLYYDISISQSFGAALEEMFMTYPLDEAIKAYKKIIVTNPLVRFAQSATEYAIPSFITKLLDEELKDTCVRYAPWSTFFSFGTYMDYLDPKAFLDPQKKCPNYQIYPDLKKHEALARSDSPLSAIVGFLWKSSPRVDQVEPVKYHLLTVPDAMGQSIQEITQPFYDSRDTLATLEEIKDFNLDLGNTVEDGGANLHTGKSSNVSNSLRLFPYYTCSDPMFSSQLDTTVEAYAMGTRYGCDQQSNAVATGLCDGKKFAEIIKDSPWKEPLPAATQIVLNSAMFVNGRLNPKLEEVYAATEKATGVPCEVLAGHHFEEATTCFTVTGNPEQCSVANGGPAREEPGGLQATSDMAAKGVLRHPITNTERLITAMSNFNGGGNSNCQKLSGITIPYTGCPRQFIGEDDPYATHMLDSKHTNMYQIYCGDFKICSPLAVYDKGRPGAFAVALAVYNEYTSKNLPPVSPSPSSTPTSGTLAGNPSTGSSLNPAGDCGTGYIDTALGCLPYERTEFAMAILRFVIGIGGGVALVVMLMGTLRIMTAAGDAKKLQSGRDLFTGAIVGLLFLIFSVTLLRIFAGDILKIPGF